MVMRRTQPRSSKARQLRLAPYLRLSRPLSYGFFCYEKKERNKVYIPVMAPTLRAGTRIEAASCTGTLVF